MAQSMIMPVDDPYRVTQWYGKTPHTNFHEGIDFVGEAGENFTGRPIRATLDGVVKMVKHTPYPYHPYGIHCRIAHVGGYETIYAHLSSVLVVVGAEVKQGNIVGKGGSTGNSTGPHLHFSVKLGGIWQDPKPLLPFDDVSPPPIEPELPPDAKKTLRVIAPNGLRVRKEPSLKGQHVTTMSYGHELYITGETVENDGYRWVKIASGQTYKGVNVGLRWSALYQMTTYAVVGLLK